MESSKYLPRIDDCLAFMEKYKPKSGISFIVSPDNNLGFILFKDEFGHTTLASPGLIEDYPQGIITKSEFNANKYKTSFLKKYPNGKVILINE